MYTLKQKQIPLNNSYDVIVVGGGPAGCTAAAAAAREGAKTLLIEATGSLGGMGTAGLVPAWCPFSDKEKIVYRSLSERIFESSKKSSDHVKKSDVDWVPVNPEALKRIYDDLMVEFNVDVLFNTVLSDVDATEADEITVNALIVSNKQGLSAYTARTYIDASGDADLTAWAGGAFEYGENGGQPMPSTHCFSLSNVDIYAYLYSKNYGMVTGGMHPNNKDSFTHKLPADERYPDIPDTHLCNNIIGPGTIGFNAGHIFNVDPTDPVNVSKALMTGRKIAEQYRDALAEYFPEAFSNSFLVSTASLLGVRESRRIIGDYTLTVDDYLNKASFHDEICRNSYYLDIHYTKEELDKKAKGEIDDDKRCARYGPGESHGIPYRSLLPKGIKNVIVAGRSISCDKRIQGSVRVMPVCLAMGEAAGIAAVYAATADCDVHAVDTNRLRETLRKYGAYFN